jgi:hypothetical protein
MERLEIRLLEGSPVARPGVANVGCESDLVRALPSYLTLKANRPDRRAVLAALVWPDQAPGDESFCAQHQTRVETYA